MKTAELTYTATFASGDTESFAMEYSPTWTRAETLQHIEADLDERIWSLRGEADHYGELTRITFERNH